MRVCENCYHFAYFHDVNERYCLKTKRINKAEYCDLFEDFTRTMINGAKKRGIQYEIRKHQDEINVLKNKLMEATHEGD